MSNINPIDKLNELMNNLADDQLLAVMSLDGICLVESGAGSGKTRVLTSRVFHMLLAGIRSENILMVSFTNKASKEMSTRLSNLLGSVYSSHYELENLSCGTFHSIGIELLRDWIHLINNGLDKEFNIVDETDCLKLIKDIIKENNLSLKERDVLNLISLSMNKLMKISDVLLNFERDVSNVSDYLLVAKEYVSRKRDLNVLDYDDVLYYLYLLLKKSDVFLNYCHERYHYILVDEYQDTNFLQDKIIELLSLGHNNVFLVGDINQSIYSWRGANLNNLLNYRNRSDVKKFSIGKNYRSQPNILKVADKIINVNSIKSDIVIEGTRDSGSNVEIYRCIDKKIESDFIVKDLIPRYLSLGYELSDIAILYRTNDYAKSIEVELIENGYSYDLRTGKKFIDKKHIKDLLAYLRMLNSLRDLISIRRVFHIFAGFGGKSVDKVIESINLNKRFNEVDLKDCLGNRLFNVCNPLLTIYNKYLNNEYSSVSDMLIEFKDEIYLPNLKMPLNNEINSETVSLLNDIDLLISMCSGYDKIKDVLDIIYLDEDLINVNNSISTKRSSDGIILSSVHKSKGLEFKNVIVVGCNDGRFPSDRSLLDTGDRGGLEEERRLMYVALTRAEDNLVLTYLDRDFDYSVGGFVNLSVSRFLKDVPDSYYTHFNVTS